MASSNVCNYRGELMQFTFTTKSKLSLSLIIFLLKIALAQIDNPTDILFSRCGNDFFINGSAMEGNLKVVLNSLVVNVSKTGFYTSSHGQKGDTIYGLAQCRGDLNTSTCRACVSKATISLCSRSSRSIYLSGCFLRYANHNFYAKISLTERSNMTKCDKPYTNGTDGNTRISDWSTSHSLSRLIDNAVSSNVGYSTLHENGLYSLAQCWRDLTMNQCRQCLDTIYNSLVLCSSEATLGYALSDNCIIRYQRGSSNLYKFYSDGVPLLSLPPSMDPPRAIGGSGPSRATHEGSSRRLPFKLGLTIGCVVSVVMLLGLVVIWKRKVTNTLYLGSDKPTSEHSRAISKSKLNYKFQTLQMATKKFNLTNKIGQGGFGSVYKGILLDGREIAVKRLFANREQSVKEFFNEVNLISHVQHKNLLNLLGFSVDGPDKFLVYEYLPNKSLDHYLYDENMGKLLDWQRRFEIILGIAGGLAYLHQESDIRIIHRDIKPSNILLDQHFKPKIADFGLVRCFGEDQTHLSTEIVGTRGYMAPEYLIHGQLTEKVDVYAFGVLVLEIISGRKNMTPMHANDMPSLLTVIWKHHLLGTISNIIDPNIEENCEDEVLQVVEVALLCTQQSARLRPSMSNVIVFLTSKEPNRPAPTQPPFIDVSHSESNSNTGGAPALYNQVFNNASSSVTGMSLNTISVRSFGPR